MKLNRQQKIKKLVEETPENIKGHPKVREAYLGEAQV